MTESRCASAFGVALYLREAIASTAASHPDDCECVTCRAHGGDLRAMAEIMAQLQAELDQR